MQNTIDENQINNSENKAVSVPSNNYYQASEFAAITQATTLILKKIDFPLNRRRNFICALQGVANGRAKFPASHYVLAKHIGHKGKQETSEMSVYREIQALISFQALANILLFDIEQGGGHEKKPTKYHDLITSYAIRLADRAKQMKRDQKELKKTPIGKVMESIVEEIVKDLRPFTGSLISKRLSDKEKSAGGGGGWGRGGKNHKANSARQKTRRQQQLIEQTSIFFKVFDPVNERDELRRYARETADYIISAAEDIIEARNDKKTKLSDKVISPKIDHPLNMGDKKNGDGLQNSSPLVSISDVSAQPELQVPALASPGLVPANPLLAAALDYASRGWHILPLHTPNADGICSCNRREKCPSSGKHPRTTNGVKDATINEIQIQKWWSQHKDANIGIAAGPGSGIVCLDIDPRNGGNEALTDIIKTYGALPATFEVETGGDGRHLFFQFPAEAEIKNSAKKLGCGIDIKAGNGFVVAAPSLHASGRRYSIKSTQEPASLPNWLIDLLTSKETESSQRLGATTTTTINLTAQNNPGIKQFLQDSSRSILSGERNIRIYKIACAMVGRGEDYTAVAAEIEKVNFLKCSPPLDETEIQQIIKNAFRHAPNNN